jgi:mRNA interferase MazF
MKLPKDATPKPRRGEIWAVDLEPTQGQEIRSRKHSDADTRPALVIQRDGLGDTATKIVVPITDFSPERDVWRPWRVALGDNSTSGLSKVSCADVTQTRTLATDSTRFKRKMGVAHPAELDATADALARGIGVTPKS